jgi:biopolymer transport protein ExbB
MSFVLYHDLTVNALYGCIAVLIFVIIERALYLAYLSVRSAGIARRLGQGRAQAGQLADLKGRDPISASVSRYVALQAQSGVSRQELEDYSAALFIAIDRRISARLWVLDTVITGAPLLGLLGTILGIMDTFTALAQGQVSDPGQVSRGIGLALTATAVGIATALLGLLFHNILNRSAHVLTEDFKSFVLRLTPPPAAPST